MHTHTHSDKNAPIGRFAWLAFSAIIFECLIVIKMGWDILTIPLPAMAYILWGIGIVVFIVCVFWYFTFPFKHMPIIGPYYRQLVTKLKVQ